MVLDKSDGSIRHTVFSRIAEHLLPGDVLVVNETKVMPARLKGTRKGSGGKAELLLLRRLATPSSDVDADSAGARPDAELWEALVKPGRRLRPGAVIEFPGLCAVVRDWSRTGTRGQRVVELQGTGSVSLDDALHAAGRLPLPPYVTGFQGDEGQYQTVYARHEQSVAAPTAGLHFTQELLAQLEGLGVKIAKVSLAVGLDTFRPVVEERIENHRIHTERYWVDEAAIRVIEGAQACGRRIIAVGTTSVRCLESAWDDAAGRLLPRNGEATSLYITPGYRFKAVDGLVTNFHVPRSTLLMLVSSLAGREKVLIAYAEAAAKGYRFLSFGDAMLIL
jgi:S-adenosylmethionine:tRNA ribosyltransferase-isomerase